MKPRASQSAQEASIIASRAATGSSSSSASVIARISGPVKQRSTSASSTPSFEPKRLKTVAREIPASSASASTVAEWNSPSLIRRSAASRTLSTLFALDRLRV